MNSDDIYWRVELVTSYFHSRQMVKVRLQLEVVTFCKPLQEQCDRVLPNEYDCFIFVQSVGLDGTYYVDIVLPDGQNVGDALCKMGVASRATASVPNAYRLDVTGGRPSSLETELPPPAVMPSSNNELNNIPNRMVRMFALFTMKFN
jgi:hypothetical protein